MTVPESAFASTDDFLHTPSASFYETETYWFSFFVPERNIGAWIYTTVRQNTGVTGGGLYLWDHTATEPWDIPFYENFSVLKLPTVDGPTLVSPTGATITVVDPGMTYDIRYDDRDRLSLTMRFEGLEAPVPLRRGAPPFGTSSHYDQTGHVTGDLVLDGERIEIDCFAMRDRSWGPRPERRRGRIGYTWLAETPVSMMTFASPTDDGDEVHAGYLRRGEDIVRIVGGDRQVVRDPSHAWVESMRITAHTETGEVFVANGHARSRFVLPSATGVCVNTLLEFDVDGHPVYGEDQDVWTNRAFRAARRGR